MRVDAPRFELLAQWIVAMSAGEFAGFLVPAIAGSLAVGLSLGDLATALVVVPAGVVEGAILGFAQGRVLPSRFPRIDPRAWTAATAAAAGVAWVCGMAASAIAQRDPGGAGVAAIVVFVAVILGSIGAGQWLILRRHAAGAGWWVPANALGWVIGMAWVFAAMALVTEDTPAPFIGLVAALSGLAMGLTAAVVTGLALVRVLRPHVLRT